MPPKLHNFIVTFRFFDGNNGENSLLSYFIKSPLNLDCIESEILYNFIFTDKDDTFNMDDCEITVTRESILTLTRKTKENIVKNLYIEAGEDIMTYLKLSDDQHMKVDEWLATQNVSLDELTSTVHTSEQYEIHVVETAPVKELPLLIGNLHTDEAKTKLEERIKNATSTPQ